MSKIIFLILIVYSVAVQAKIYKSTDANGKVHYSDKPLLAKSNEVILQVNKSKMDQDKVLMEASKSVKEYKKVDKGKLTKMQENLEYCTGVKSEMEWNKSGGELIVVDGNKFEKATDAHRQKSYRYLENEYKTHCL